MRVYVCVVCVVCVCVCVCWDVYAFACKPFGWVCMCVLATYIFVTRLGSDALRTFTRIIRF